MMRPPVLRPFNWPPRMLFSDSYLIGLLFGLSCIVVRESLLLLQVRCGLLTTRLNRFLQRRYGFIMNIWSYPIFCRMTFSFFYCLALVGGSGLLFWTMQGLVYYCIVMGTLPPVFLAVFLHNTKWGHPSIPRVGAEMTSGK